MKSATRKRTEVLDTKNWLYVAILSLAAIIFRAAIPPQIMSNYYHDDFLGVRLANSILNGEWLGAWTNLTFAKPPGYPIFLAISNKLLIGPVNLAFLIHVFNSILLYLLISRGVLGKKGLSGKTTLTLFAVVLFNPIYFGGTFSRIYRTSLSTVLMESFFLLCLTQIYLLLRYWKRRQSKKENSKRISIPTLIKIITMFYPLGFTYGLLVITRSETSFLLIAAFMSFILLLLLKSPAIRERNMYFAFVRNTMNPRVLSGVALALVLFLAGWNSPISAIEHVNKRVYGFQGIEDYYSGSFADSIKIWATVQNGKSSYQFVQISKGQRLAVYEISPTAKLLEKALEEPPPENGWNWKTNNCSATSVCDESGSWFPWELRDAALKTFSITNQSEFEQIFRSLFQEIEVACERKKINCSGLVLETGTKPVSDWSKRQLLDTSIGFLVSILKLEQVGNTLRPSVGENTDQLSIWKNVLRHDRITALNEMESSKAFANSVNAVRFLYEPLFLFSPILLIVFVFTYRNRDVNDNMITYYLLFLITTIVLYCGGVAVLQMTVGMEIERQLYLLPIQPLYVLLCSLIGFSVLTKQQEVKDICEK